MLFRLFVGACQVVVFALVATPAVGDEPPTLVKVRLKGGRSAVEESREAV